MASEQPGCQGGEQANEVEGEDLDGRQLPEELFASTGFLLAMTGAESRRRFMQALAAWDLRTSHYGVLMALAAFGPMSQRQLGHLIGVDPRNLVAMIDLLEGRGLAERQPDASDRRRRAVRLTAEGGALLNELRHAGEALEEDMLLPLSAAERATLHSLLLRLAAPGRLGKLGHRERGDSGEGGGEG
jgi:DNA-binding MarR family transcriptional regulator